MLQKLKTLLRKELILMKEIEKRRLLNSNQTVNTSIEKLREPQNSQLEPRSKQMEPKQPQVERPSSFIAGGGGGGGPGFERGFTTKNMPCLIDLLFRL